jgi:hypothetical protein
VELAPSLPARGSMLKRLLVSLRGKLPLNVQVGGYHNAVRPNQAPEWNVRLQVQFLFPR